MAAEWEEYIKGIIGSEGTKDVRIGIVSYNENKELAEKYLMELMVPCGFIRLKLGIEESTQIILKASTVAGGDTRTQSTWFPNGGETIAAGDLLTVKVHSDSITTSTYSVDLFIAI